MVSRGARLAPRGSKMKHILTGISLGLLTLAVGTLKVVASSEVGLHIEFSDIKNTFSRHVVKYIG